MFGPTNNFLIKHRKILPNSLTSIGLPGFIEVRDSQTGYLIPARDGPGALPYLECSWDAVAAAAAVAVSRKMPKD